MKFLNFGSLNLDYVYSVPHFVQAGETLSATKREIFPGGKGLNQSIALSRAGGQVYHAGGVGAEDGQLLLELLSENAVDVSAVKQVSIPTGHAMIQVETGGQNCILIFGGANKAMEPEQIKETISAFSSGDVLVLQNEVNGLELMMREAKKIGMKIAFNPSPIDETISQLPLELVDIFLVNEIEAEALSGCGAGDGQMLAMQKKYPGAEILITLGSKGSLYGGSCGIVPCGTYQAKVVDTTAAGDTFTGYFLTALLSGIHPGDAMKRAAKAAALAVSQKGASPSIPTAANVLEAELKYIPMK